MAMYKYYRGKNYREYLKKLVRQCLKGDLASWDELLDGLSPLVSHVVKSKICRTGFGEQGLDAENIKQEILLSIWKDNKLCTIRDIDNIIAWICAYASNFTSNYIRKIKPCERPKASRLNESLTTYIPTPYKHLIDKEQAARISSALKSLNKKEGLIIKLHLLYGKRFKEISQILKLPIGTVLVYAMRAKSKLKKKLR